MAIAKSTYTFLEQLKENNNREWFQEHKHEYELAHQDVKDFLQEVILRLAGLDPHIHQDIQVAKCLFRIYRDVRFSKNKAPYKTWFAAGISVEGRKLEGPEYYIHLEPGRNFVAVGYWRPKKEHLEAIRQEIDYNANGLVDALASGFWTVDDLDKDDKLVRPPSGYGTDHPFIDVLKLKSFIVFESISDTEMTSAAALNRVLDVCERALPFKRFLHAAIDQ